MSGEPGTEPDILELEDLRAQVNDLEGDLEACQDDLADMTQRKDELATALEEALGQLSDIEDTITINALDQVYRNNV